MAPRHALRRVWLACVCCAFVIAPARVALGADQSVSVNVMPGATPSPGALASCVQTRSAGDAPQQTYPRGGTIRVLLEPGCAERSERHIEIDVESVPVLLLFADAGADGGFLTNPQPLPASVTAGPHDVVVRTVEHTYRAPIMVTAAATQVLGESVNRGQVLAHTGADVVRLVVAAMALIAAGAALVVGSRMLGRRRRTQDTSRSHSRRNRVGVP